MCREPRPRGWYRTTPLKGLWTHLRQDLHHDGRFPTLDAILDHYDTQLSLGLTSIEKRDPAEYRRSL